MDDFDEYGMYEDDLQEFSDREAWEDAMADASDGAFVEVYDGLYDEVDLG